MILVLSVPRDFHADAVMIALRRKGVQAVRVHEQDFPSRCKLSLRHERGSLRALLERRGVRRRLSDATTVWYRRSGPPTLPPELDKRWIRYAQAECKSAWFGLWLSMERAFWVNPPHPQARAHEKLYQLDVGSRLGFEIPRTLVSNSREELRAFYRACRGRVVYKSFYPPAVFLERKTRADDELFTTVLEPKHLWDRGRFKAGPGLFQELVPKSFELRVTLIGNAVFATRINSQSHEDSRVDWRRRQILTGEGMFEAYDLPETVKRRCLALQKALGLRFGCIDLIVTPDGRYVFLENNPSGQWLWVEIATRQPLLDHFCEMLIQRRVDYRIPRSRVLTPWESVLPEIHPGARGPAGHYVHDGHLVHRHPEAK